MFINTKFIFLFFFFKKEPCKCILRQPLVVEQASNLSQFHGYSFSQFSQLRNTKAVQMTALIHRTHKCSTVLMQHSSTDLKRATWKNLTRETAGERNHGAVRQKSCKMELRWSLQVLILSWLGSPSVLCRLHHSYLKKVSSCSSSPPPPPCTHPGETWVLVAAQDLLGREGHSPGPRGALSHRSQALKGGEWII